MMNCFVARQSGPDGLLKFDLLCWSMTSFSDNSFFMIIYLYYRGTKRLLRWPGLYCAVRHCPNMHKEKSPYSEEFIIYAAGSFFSKSRVKWGLSFGFPELLLPVCCALCSAWEGCRCSGSIYPVTPTCTTEGSQLEGTGNQLCIWSCRERLELREGGSWLFNVLRRYCVCKFN